LWAVRRPSRGRPTGRRRSSGDRGDVGRTVPATSGGSRVGVPPAGRAAGRGNVPPAGRGSPARAAVARRYPVHGRGRPVRQQPTAGVKPSRRQRTANGTHGREGRGTRRRGRVDARRPRVPPRTGRIGDVGRGVVGAHERAVRTPARGSNSPTPRESGTGSRTTPTVPTRSTRTPRGRSTTSWRRWARSGCSPATPSARSGNSSAGPSTSCSGRSTPRSRSTG
jgi:hypothetical protein